MNRETTFNRVLKQLLNTDSSWTSYELAKMVGCSQSSAYRALAKLVGMGLVWRKEYKRPQSKDKVCYLYYVPQVEVYNASQVYFKGVSND